MPVREVRRDDAAEGEAEVAGPAELRLHPPRPGSEVREGAADAVHGGRHARLDVDRARAGNGDVGLPARVDHDAPLAHGVPDQLVHLVVAGELVVAVHDDCERRLPRPGPGGLEGVPRVRAAAARAHAPTGVGVVAAAWSRLRLRRLGDRRGSRRSEDGQRARGGGKAGDAANARHPGGSLIRPGANCGSRDGLRQVGAPCVRRSRISR